MIWVRIFRQSCGLNGMIIGIASQKVEGTFSPPLFVSFYKAGKIL
jgi:hypothetical protein